MKIDDEQRFNEERAADLRDRDRQREPGKSRFHRLRRRDLAGRDAFQIGLSERAAAQGEARDEQAPTETAAASVDVAPRDAVGGPHGR